MSKRILVAGGTGNLGGKIVNALLDKGAAVSVLVRNSTDAEKINGLKDKGVQILEVEPLDIEQVTKACLNIDCIVSALAGLREVIIDTQKVLVDAAVAAKVPRFIPSDYALDFKDLKPGGNRNLDMIREFHSLIKNKPIQITSIFNGPFMDLLTGEMPLILSKINRILYWGDSKRLIDFTVTDDVAAYTANVAIDSNTPRYLYIAGDRINCNGIKNVVSEVTGDKYKLLRAGSVGMLKILIKITKTFSPGKDELYPAWQGMQYMKDMMEGRVKVEEYDTHRYPDVRWTSVKDFLVSEGLGR